MSIINNRLTPDEYQHNFSDIHPPFETQGAALVEANRCLFCYDAPCTKSCPTGINVPKFIKQITTDNIKGSAHTILSANIMGGGCSKVCPVEKLCEGACVFNLMEEEAIPIAKLSMKSTATTENKAKNPLHRKTPVKPKNNHPTILGLPPTEKYPNQRLPAPDPTPSPEVPRSLPLPHHKTSRSSRTTRAICIVLSENTTAPTTTAHRPKKAI